MAVHPHRHSAQDCAVKEQFTFPSINLQQAKVDLGLRALCSTLKEATLETFWPTRCCVCDLPGYLLCPECEAQLKFLDTWQACPRCGAPYGRLQCTECIAFALQSIGRESFPFDGCTSAVFLTNESRRIVTTWKDQHECRLGEFIAEKMIAYLPPHLSPRRTEFKDAYVISAIPASPAARARRGYDHGELLAQTLAEKTGLRSYPLLKRRRAQDQRVLSRKERAHNTRDSFMVNPQLQHKAPPRHVLLIDDVFTTGSTLSAATDVLKAHGVHSVWCLTFARTF